MHQQQAGITSKPSTEGLPLFPPPPQAAPVLHQPFLNTGHGKRACFVSNIPSAKFQAFFLPMQTSILVLTVIMMYFFLSYPKSVFSLHRAMVWPGSCTPILLLLQHQLCSWPRGSPAFLGWLSFWQPLIPQLPTFPRNVQFSRLCCQLLESAKSRVHQAGLSAKSAPGEEQNTYHQHCLK